MKALFIVAVLFILVGFNLFAQKPIRTQPKRELIAYYNYFPGKTPYYIIKQVKIYSNGDVQADVQSGYDGSENTTYSIAQIGETSLGVLQKAISEIDPQGTMDENEEDPECWDAPSSHYGVIVDTKDVILESDANCHHYINKTGRGLALKQVIDGFVQLMDLKKIKLVSEE